MLRKLDIEHHYQPLDQAINAADPVWKAWRLMKESDVKTLPVVKADKIVGLVCDRDIVQISGFNGGQSMAVKEAMSLDPLVVRLDESMEQVLRSMLKKEQQAAVVVDDQNKIVGLFSWACAFEFFLNFANINHLNQLLSS